MGVPKNDDANDPGVQAATDCTEVNRTETSGRDSAY